MKRELSLRDRENSKSMKMSSLKGSRVSKLRGAMLLQLRNKPKKQLEMLFSINLPVKKPREEPNTNTLKVLETTSNFKRRRRDRDSERRERLKRGETKKNN